MIAVDSISKAYPGKVLFEDLSFTMSKGEKLGLVGSNGCGKSTLIKIIVGELETDSGRVVFPKGYRVGYLSQHLNFTEPTVLKECTQGLELHEHYKAERILEGLGFNSENLNWAPSQFSGGYQLRINLAKCILEEPDLLILDEPTNYLDLLSLRWLSHFLKTISGEVILITHDQYFMDQIVTHVLGIQNSTGRKVKGSSEKYYEQIEMEIENLIREKANQDQKIKEMEKFVERFRAKASKATQAQSKLKALQKMKVYDDIQKDRSLGFSFSYKDTPAKRLFKVENLEFSYPNSDLLYKNLSFEVTTGQRIAVVGQNGKGKTTLLRHIAGELENAKGELSAHPQTEIGFYHQTNKKDLDPEMTVVEEISQTNTKLSLTEVRGICGAVMFPGDEALKKVSVLSGGEQARVLLGKVLAYPSNLLLLDEPTNHLDRSSVKTLCREIKKYKGSVLFVTHHEGLLHDLATQMIYFKNGEAHLFKGNYAEFLEKIGWEEKVIESAPTKKVTSSKERNELRKKLNKTLRAIEKIESEVQDIEQFLEEKNKIITELLLRPEDSKKLSEVYQEIGKAQLSVEAKFKQLEPLYEDKSKIELEME